MAEPKTRPTDTDVDAFLASVTPPQRRSDALAMCELMQRVTGERPIIWGTSIVGFGSREYQRGRSGTTTWPLVAFAPRKSDLVLYLSTQIDQAIVDAIGPHRRGAGCVYVKRLEALDTDALVALIERSFELAQA